MKTKKILLMLIISITSWNLLASVEHVYLNNTYDAEYFYFCGVDSIIVHKPTEAVSNIYWDPPFGPDTYADSVIVTNNTGTYWFFYSDEWFKYVYVYILTDGPSEPECMITDTSFCSTTFTLSLDARNHLPGGYASSYLWSTGETTPTITVDTTGSYWVSLLDNDGCSGKDTVEITALLPISEEICFVEFDTATWKNSINWTGNLPENADSVRIYKEDGINFVPIGTVYKDSTHFLDFASDPQAQSYSYKVSIVDTCGNESDLSGLHKTITLVSSYNQLSNTYGFNWSHYLGLVVSYYYLYGIDAFNNVTLIATVNGSVQMYNYENPNPAFIKYYVGFETPSCDGTKTNIIVKSNWIIKDPLITGTQEIVIIPFTVYPNPATDQITINIGFETFEVQILSMLGQVILTEHNVKTLNLSTLQKGVYIISVSADGIKTNRRFIKN